MSEDTQWETPHYKIKKVGIVDLDGLYRLMHRWYVDRNYYFEEPTYKHKVPSPAGAEEEFEWFGWRKMNDYVKYWILAYMHFYEMKEVEIIKDGKKKKMIRARVYIEVWGTMEWDWQKRWQGSKFLENVRKFMDQYFFMTRDKIGSSVWGDRLMYVAMKLHSEIKEHLEMETLSDTYADMW
ncbi:MAG: hypothetical protein Q7J54_05885 [Candidatus Woesearchaeota archaeon]|nr:hypothetical protein [Candidatus Woesearchaeota archaeon]